MKAIVIVAAVAAFVSSASAAFIPLTLQEKAKRADLIVRGKVVSISRLMPEKNLLGSDGLVGFDGTGGSCLGPRSIAVIEVYDTWKSPVRTSFSSNESTKRNVVPSRIMVPCDYSLDESPSDLSEGRTYVLFLKAMTANLYHPLDPASTHVVHDGRVADFGMNLPPEMNFKVPGKELFTDRSSPLKKFKGRVTSVLKANTKGSKPKSP